MNLSRRRFMRNIGLGAAGLGLASKKSALASAPVKRDSEKLLVKDPDHPAPAPVGVDRLPLSWYKSTVQRLKDKAAEKGVAAIVLEDSWNMTYFTGNFMTKTERCGRQ